MIKLKPNVNEVGSSQSSFMSPRSKWKHKLLYNECSNCFYCGIAITCWYWREMTAYSVVGNFAYKIYIEKSFAACSLVLPKDASPSNLRGKLSQIAIKPQYLWKFLPLKVSCYTLPSCITEREITVWLLLISCSHAAMAALKWSRCWLKIIIVVSIPQTTMVTLHSVKLAGKYSSSLPAC